MRMSRKAETAAVTATFEMNFAGSDAGETITATLLYNVFEPFTVTAGFALGDAPAVQWVLARDLLREGVVLPSGIGDIRIYPTEDSLYIELHSPSGRAVLQGPIAPVVEFVTSMYRAVPEDRESEYFSVDAQLDLFSGLYIQPDNGQ